VEPGAVGDPKYTVSDQGSEFGEEYLEWCDDHDVRARFGAVGRHGSISVEERFIGTLWDELIKRRGIECFHPVDDLREARVGDLVERGAICVQVPDLIGFDDIRLSRPARPKSRSSARSSPPHQSSSVTVQQKGQRQTSSAALMDASGTASRTPRTQDDSDVHHQPLPEPVSEEQDIHADHDGYPPGVAPLDALVECLRRRELTWEQARERAVDGRIAGPLSYTYVTVLMELLIAESLGGTAFPAQAAELVLDSAWAMPFEGLRLHVRLAAAKGIIQVAVHRRRSGVGKTPSRHFQAGSEWLHLCEPNARLLWSNRLQCGGAK
jgi:hypothetical protein